MVSSIPIASRTAHPSNILDKYTGNRLLANLPQQAIAQLEPDLRQVGLRQGVMCYDAGNPIDQVFFPQTGMISLLVSTSDGVRFATNSVGRYGAVGLQCGNGPRLSRARAIVQIGGDFWVISAPRFEAATGRSAELRELIFTYTERLWAEAQQNAACNAIHDGSSRLCRWLLQCTDRTGGERLLLTQELLAEMLGVRRTTVTLFAQELQKRGILRYSRGRITILNRAALEACTCECYEVIKKLSTVTVLPTPSLKSKIL
jgi:CRP-like cAMP-binding protein